MVKRILNYLKVFWGVDFEKVEVKKWLLKVEKRVLFDGWLERVDRPKSN